MRVAERASFFNREPTVAEPYVMITLYAGAKPDCLRLKTDTKSFALDVAALDDAIIGRWPVKPEEAGVEVSFMVCQHAPGYSFDDLMRAYLMPAASVWKSYKRSPSATDDEILAEGDWLFGRKEEPKS